MRHSILAAGLLTAAAALSFPGGDAQASSHREAPFITKNPKVDGTDFYMFQSYSADRIQGDGTSEYTTLIANYIPLQDAYGGPNYFSFDPEAIYEIHVENSGDAVEDITFQFKFTNALAGGTPGVTLDVGGKKNSVPTVQANVAQVPTPTPITLSNESMLLNVQESYTINMIRGARRSGPGVPVKDAGNGSTTFRKPIDNIGQKTFGETQNTTAQYKTYADGHIYNVTLDGCDTPAKVFVGQRQEGFRVNLGVIFDLVNADLGTITKAANRNALTGTPFDNTADKNITSIAMEIPTKCLTSDGKPAASSARPVLGGWTTASVRQARLINPDATYDKPTKEGGAWTQVSRLGMPLTNEVVIGIADKDKWNSSEPSKDTQFIDYVTNPTLPQILQAIFGCASTPIFPAGEVARTDLVDIFLKGVPGVNVTGSTAEMLRLNTKLPTKGTGAQTGGNFGTGAVPANALSGLGAAGCFSPAANCTPAGKTQADCYTVVAGPACDTGGFPNGRRPGDDVTDIELTAVLGYFLPQAPWAAPFSTTRCSTRSRSSTPRSRTSRPRIPATRDTAEARMVNKKITFACLALSVAFAAFQVGCGDDDNSNPNADTGVPDTEPATDGGPEGGPCKFNDFVLGLINNSTTATALPSTDLGEKCTDDQTPFPATVFQ